MNPFSALHSFLEKIKSLGFWQRLFSWQKVKSQLIEAASALSQVQTELKNLEESRTSCIQEISGYRKDIRLLEEQKIRLEEGEKRTAASVLEKDGRIAELTRQSAAANANCKNLEEQMLHLRTELAELRENLRLLNGQLKETREENVSLKSEEELRRQEQAKAVDTFQKWREQLQAERNREIEEKQQAEIERLKKLKQTWSNHEQEVRERMKTLCQRLTIEYADSVPFRGTPDNAIKLANEYIVFDAKSPASDDLNNFPLYLKDQAEKAKKYAKQEGVKKDIFFVVPSNTLDVIRQTVFPLGDFDVFIVSADILEPLLLCLQKIETYEFAEQLTPEERENICRIIGRFTHLTKRRIQIDSFFAKQFMEMVLKCDSELPEEIKQEVAGFEKAEKLNPPGDRRTKALDIKELQSDMLQLELEISRKGIATGDLSEDLNRVKLYKE